MAEGSFHIHVHDLCLDVGTKLTANIHVSSVYSIDVQVADKVSGGKVVVVLRPIVFCWKSSYDYCKLCTCTRRSTFIKLAFA